jgi:hypothetical protein
MASPAFRVADSAMRARLFLMGTRNGVPHPRMCSTPATISGPERRLFTQPGLRMRDVCDAPSRKTFPEVPKNWAIGPIA